MCTIWSFPLSKLQILSGPIVKHCSELNGNSSKHYALLWKMNWQLYCVVVVDWQQTGLNHGNTSPAFFKKTNRTVLHRTVEMLKVIF